MSKVIKQMQMDALKKTFTGVRDLVLLSASGLSALEENQMRLGLRKKKIYMHMVKNSLARRVFSDLGMKLDKAWAGPTVLAWGADSLADLSKTLDAIMKKNKKLLPKTALADGQEVSFKQALAMPTRSEALARVVGLALAPAARIVGQIKAPAARVVGQIRSLKDKAQAEGAPAEAAPAQ